MIAWAAARSRLATPAARCTSQRHGLVVLTMRVAVQPRASGAGQAPSAPSWRRRLRLSVLTHSSTIRPSPSKRKMFMRSMTTRAPVGSRRPAGDCVNGCTNVPSIHVWHAMYSPSATMIPPPDGAIVEGRPKGPEVLGQSCVIRVEPAGTVEGEVLGVEVGVGLVLVLAGDLEFSRPDEACHQFIARVTAGHDGCSPSLLVVGAVHQPGPLGGTWTGTSARSSVVACRWRRSCTRAYGGGLAGGVTDLLCRVIIWARFDWPGHA